MPSHHEQRSVRAAAIVAALLLSAMWIGRGSTQLLTSVLASNWREHPLSSARAPAPTRGRTPQTPNEIAQVVLARNIFDSATGPLGWEELLEPTGRPPHRDAPRSEAAAAEIAPCDDDLRLVAAAMVPRRPELSRASLSSGSEGGTSLYRQGMTVQGREVVDIRAEHVFLRPSGRPLCQASMFSARTGLPSARQREESAQRSRASPPAADFDAGIVQVDERSFRVARSLLDRLLSSNSELLGIARAIPYEEKGRVLGVKVYGIRPGSLLAELGVQNGDLLRSLNGFDLSSPDGALDAYTKLRSADHLSLTLTRRGQPRSIEYQVQ